MKTSNNFNGNIFKNNSKIEANNIKNNKDLYLSKKECC